MPGKRQGSIMLLFLLWLCSFGSAAAGEGAQKEDLAVVQKHGNAAARIQPEKVENEGGEVRISRLLVTLSVEGRSPLTVETAKELALSLEWSALPAAPPAQLPLAGGKARWQAAFHLEAPVNPDEDVLRLAPLRFREGDKASWQTVEWQPIPIRSRPAPGPEQLAPPPSRAWMAWVVLGVALVGATLAGWQRQRRRGTRQPPLLPGQWAKRELERLAAREVAARVEVEQFHMLVSDVLRRYLELRFQLPAPEQTTAELLYHLKHFSRLSSDQQIFLEEFLRRCDLVKFAREQSSPQQCRELATQARNFVEETSADGVDQGS